MIGLGTRGMIVFERFTDRARKVMALANQECHNLNHKAIGTEHILLGLIKEGGGVAAHALKNLGIDLQAVRLVVTGIAVPGPEMVTIGNLPQDPNAKGVINKAINAARELNHNYVGTEHLLLGLISQEDGVAHQALLGIGLTREVIKDEVINLLGVSNDQATTVTPVLAQDKIEALAIRGHAGQKRSDGNDYINHPRSVRQRLINCGIKDKNVLVAALYHDLLEDTDVTEAEIEEVAGREVLEAVKQLTNIVPYGTSFVEKTVKMLEHAKHYNDIAKRVKLADRYDNLADAIWTWEPRQVKRYAKVGLQLLDVMEPFPDDVAMFALEARRFFSCLV